jgi:hypothetical protein
MSDLPTEDEELLNRLRTVLGRVDPVPPEVSEFAWASLGWRRLEVELAELLADSTLDAEAAALARGGGDGARWLTFRAPDLTVDVEVRRDGATFTLLGQLAPAAAAEIEVQAADGSVAATASSDELGRFRLVLASGRVRLRITRQSGTPVETSWLPL